MRRPAFAGRFYPESPVELRQLVSSLLGGAGESVEAPPKAIIAPHAGYIYSGPIAASAYVRLARARDLIRRVVLLGPSHRVAFKGLACSSADEFATPLGAVPLDRTAIQTALSLRQVSEFDEAHQSEHSLEVHLPFLQVILEDFKLVPLVVGDAGIQEVSEVIDLLWGGPETRFVISSDLSHYLDADTARRFDRETANAIECLKPEAIGQDAACGRVPIRGLLNSALRHRLKCRAVDLRNSGDTAGPRHQVVGYGAFVFEE